MTYLWIPFLILAAFAIVWLFYSDRMRGDDPVRARHPRCDEREMRARETLRVARGRLERGEITRKQYLEIRRSIG